MKKVLATVAASAAILVSGAGAAPSGCWGACVSKAQIAKSKYIIRKVFGRYANQALSVSHCESGWSIRAFNGQYLGLFQMGSWERRTFGHGNGSWAQARGAHRYFVASGRDWSPWACKP